MRQVSVKRPSKTGWPEWRDAKGSIDLLCAEISSGNNLNRWVTGKGFNYALVRNWISSDAGRESKYARAREDRADLLADEIVEIADEVSVEYVTEDGETVEVKMDATAVARNRLRVDARKWAASKLKPKSYGDRTTLAGDPDAPLATTVYALSDEELKAKILAKHRA